MSAGDVIVVPTWKLFLRSLLLAATSGHFVAGNPRCCRAAEKLPLVQSHNLLADLEPCASPGLSK